jgi:hypothetical protein
MATRSIGYEQPELIFELKHVTHKLIAHVFGLAPHVHTHSYPVFVERRGDASPVHIADRCSCGDMIRRDYLHGYSRS